VEIPGAELLPFWRTSDRAVEEIQRFITVIRHEEAALDRVLATVLFTDIVGSTTRAKELGDLAWKDLIERHHSVVRAMLRRYRGSEVNTMGDGFFATFDGPARGVRCALAIVDAVRPLGLEVRAGLHTGEVEMMNDTVGGIAVHIGARVGALAGTGEIPRLQHSERPRRGLGSDVRICGRARVEGRPRSLARVPSRTRSFVTFGIDREGESALPVRRASSP
jgi:class 3 adenylate cyclase